MKLAIVIKFIVCLALTFSVAFVGSIFTRDAVPDWYAALNKPSFTPPNWLFGPVWTILYLLMSISAFIVWQKGLTQSAGRIALIFYLIQLILNALWSVIFFGLKLPLAAFIEIILLWSSIVFTILTFARVSMLAAVLLVPYILWVFFAAVLNFFIWFLNR
ncbi:MAG: TspO protein [Planctomycetes bacterium RBG_13_46_10]|nr:MAG: TspO protein [Planctomycetes bacterium RBG_13_46_10]